MIAIASDHGGFALKQELMARLDELSISYTDLGCYSTDSVDYPAYALAVCREVTEGRAEKGILVCGTGIGMSICANKVRGIRAAVVSDCYSAEMTRQHNDSNVLCLGGRTVGPEVAKRIMELFLTTPFSGLEKHARRLAAIAEAESAN